MDNLQSRYTREEKSTFVIVYGAARTGTSLCMDLVKAAGFNAGVLRRQPGLSLRRGRNEHEVFGKKVDAGSLRVLEQEQITCGKIIGFDDWIPWLAERFSIKILAPYRLKESRQSSVKSRGHSVIEQDRVLSVREQILPLHEHLKVSFEKLINKDADEFDAIAKFLDCNPDVLMDCVDIEWVKFP